MKTLLIKIGAFIVTLLAGVEGTNAGSPADSREATQVQESGLSFSKLEYRVSISSGEARVAAEVAVECDKKEPCSTVLFTGDLALLPLKLPKPLRIERIGDTYMLSVSRPGRYQFTVELVAKVKDFDPWKRITFKGPLAAIASVSAEAAGDAEVQLLTGAPVSNERSNGVARVKGFLGGEREVSIRWSSRDAPGEILRTALFTVETTATVQVTPGLMKHTSRMRYDVLQGTVSKVLIEIPASQTLSRVTGQNVRDWEIKRGADTGAKVLDRPQVLEVQFTKPIEQRYDLTLYSEETVESMPANLTLRLPEPKNSDRETGTLTILSEDAAAEVSAVQGLTQVNAIAGALAAYRFDSRPFSLMLKVRRIEPQIAVFERVHAIMEETRVVSRHTLDLDVTGSGVYRVDLGPAPGTTVAEVTGPEVEDWSATHLDGEETLRVNFKKKALGNAQLQVVLERPFKQFPANFELESLKVVGAAKQSSQIGVAAARGIGLKTSELVEAREVAVRAIGATGAGQPNAGQESLGYKADQAGWKVTLQSERLSPRIISDVFNLVTIGDGILGGSATIWYGLLNQGVQEFDLTIPATWKNVEFTGPNIRRKDKKADGTWTIGLQDKAWGGYTLVVTYDFEFDSKVSVLSVGGLHTQGVERETGSVVITTAGGMKVSPKTVSDTLRRVDEMELPAANRSLITRAVLLAYEYNERQYQLEVQAEQFQEISGLSAVADRTQLTTVLTDAGEMLTQASFMVKNNDKQFQRFKLPKGARFWSCHVNGQPVKAEQDGDWVMAPLPRGANRNQAFAVDIVYAGTNGVKPGFWPRELQLQAPQTDVPNTYAEWELFAPSTCQLSGLGGNMTPVRGTTYDLQDAWEKFTRFYREFLHESGPGLLVILALSGLVVALIASAKRHGAGGVVSVVVTFAIITILAAMLLPALARAKARAQRINGINNLKQIGLAARTFALDNNNRLPQSFEEMLNELSTDKITYDPETGQRYTYIGAGYDLEKILPESVIAFSPPNSRNYRDVVLADGSVQQLTASKFEALERRGLILPATAQQVAQNQQAAAVRGAQLQTAPVLAPAMDPAATPNANPRPRMRSIRIDVPRQGQALTFTKVLHLDERPLLLQVRLMSLGAFQTAQMCLQSAAFCLGLWIVWRQWRARGSTLLMTVGLCLILCSVGSLLLSWRVLHLAFIWTTPICILAIVGWFTWRFWPRSEAGSSGAKTQLTPAVPPAVAALILSAVALLPAEAAPEYGRQSSATITAANYSVAVVDQVANVEVTLTLSGAGANEGVFLFQDDVAIQQFHSTAADTKFVRKPGGVSAIFPHGGTATLRLSLAAKLGGDVTKRLLSFSVPAALSSHWDIRIDQSDADVEFPAAIWTHHSTEAGQSRVEAIMGPGERALVQWTPRVKRAAEIESNVSCNEAVSVTVGGRVLRARATFKYQVTQGEMRQALVRLPAGHKLLRVEGDFIRTWEMTPENGEEVVKVELLKPMPPEYRLTIETEKVIGPLPARVRCDVPHPIRVARQAGVLALQTQDEMEIALEETSDLYRIETEEFASQSEQKLDGAFNAFRFLTPAFNLQLRVSAMQPHLEAQARNSIRVSQEQVTLQTAIDYTTRRAGVFRLRLALPQDYRLDSVNGSNILQTAERAEATGRVLEITLKERTSGTYPLRVELTRSLKDLPQSLPIAGCHPLDMQKINGLILVLAEPGVALKPAVFDGLTEIPAAEAGKDSSTPGNGLAYRFVATEPQPASSWHLELQTEKIESWVKAELVTILTVSDTLINGRALARFDVQNAPVKELHLVIPTEFRNVEVSAPNIRRKDHAGENWTVEFQSKIFGPHVVEVTWEQTKSPTTDFLELRGVGARNVERETGVLVVVARPPLQVAATSSGDLKPTDLRDIPEWAGSPDEGAVLAYRYLRPGYKLGISATRFVEAEILQALVESLQLNTVLADDGQMMTEMSLTVRNRNRQHLEITLPQGAAVWSAFVGGQPVRPAFNQGKLLLPLEQSVGDDSAIPIEILYVDSRPFPKGSGTVDLVSPILDAPIRTAHWELFLPPDYIYSGFSGSMAHEVETTSVEASGFSFLDYSSRESSSKARLASELKSELNSAQQKLSSGNVKEAIADFNKARNKSDLAAANNAQARQLEADLRHAQANNLIEAQNSFSQSYADSGVQGSGKGQDWARLHYKNEDAEAQWTKLQQAQDLGTASAQPIHVNLPTRGLHHSFSQLLQTQTGKPLTIRLNASNNRVHTWPRRIGGSMAGFLGLWAAAFLVKRHFHRPNPAQTTG